jgi:hypothetical protein
VVGVLLVLYEVGITLWAQAARRRQPEEPPLVSTGSGADVP